ncbi:MAG: signal peptidase II [Thermodesulfobacteriota bacterium]|nr:signal peptidase II [Thermodesulfobacteriota bacterium]
MQSKYRLPLSIAAVVLVLDQASKLLIEQCIAKWESVPVIPGFFNLVHVLNKGAVFGFLNRSDTTWQVYFFITASLAAVAVILYLLRTGQYRDRIMLTGLGLILGGALGNLFDRVRLGFVIDFLDFYVRKYHWPAFNVADIAITTGTLTLIVSFYIKQKKRPATR